VITKEEMKEYEKDAKNGVARQIGPLLRELKMYQEMSAEDFFKMDKLKKELREIKERIAGEQDE